MLIIEAQNSRVELLSSTGERVVRQLAQQKADTGREPVTYRDTDRPDEEPVVLEPAAPISIEVMHYTPSFLTDTPRAVDADVMVRFASGAVVEGGITVLPAQDSRRDGEWTAWGSPENWATPDLARLGAEVLRAIEGSVDGAACARLFVEQDASRDAEAEADDAFTVCDDLSAVPVGAVMLSVSAWEEQDGVTVNGEPTHNIADAMLSAREALDLAVVLCKAKQLHGYLWEVLEGDQERRLYSIREDGRWYAIS
jgi:hypothetical protein